MDVKSLYTQLPQHEAITAVLRALKKADTTQHYAIRLPSTRWFVQTHSQGEHFLLWILLDRCIVDLGTTLLTTGPTPGPPGLGVLQSWTVSHQRSNSVQPLNVMLNNPFIKVISYPYSTIVPRQARVLTISN